MTTDPSGVERRMAHFETVCRDSGIKLTHQRLEIFREVAQTGDHPDAEKVYQGVRERMPTVSLDTVYLKTDPTPKKVNIVTAINKRVVFSLGGAGAARIESQFPASDVRRIDWGDAPADFNTGVLAYQQRKYADALARFKRCEAAVVTSIVPSVNWRWSRTS